MIRTAAIVIASSYALFVCMVVVTVRRPVPRPSGRGGPSPPGLVRRVAVTVAGGYLVFLLVVLVFHVWVAGERGALLSAVRGGVPLTGVAVAAFALLSWVECRARP
ncbi:MAG TPA: DUF6256 family protein [Actinomycetota bacterium]|nr:DUF6256 family protein [Actinomycetota bacterium]